MALIPLEFQDAVEDTIWYLYQYYWSAQRGIDIWCIHLLRNNLEHFAKVSYLNIALSELYLDLKRYIIRFPLTP